MNRPDHLSSSSAVNETALEVIDSKEINITGADTNHWTLQGLKGDSLYRFDLRACTRAGCGPPQAEESRTDFPEPGELMKCI